MLSSAISGREKPYLPLPREYCFIKIYEQITSIYTAYRMLSMNGHNGKLPSWVWQNLCFYDRLEDNIRHSPILFLFDFPATVWRTGQLLYTYELAKLDYYQLEGYIADRY